MERQIIKSKDNSHTIYIPELDEHYHSVNGAIQESNHIFINAGLKEYISRFSSNELINIFEMGFGTGLNALVTYLYAKKEDLNIRYHGIEKFPLDNNLLERLNYAEELNCSQDDFRKIHSTEFETESKIDSDFLLKKMHTDLLSFTSKIKYNIIYFDAFGPDVQPELWTEEVFNKVASIMDKNSIFVTYSAKGSVKRALIAAGLTVEKVPGPPGKREMIRAFY